MRVYQFRHLGTDAICLFSKTRVSSSKARTIHDFWVLWGRQRDFLGYFVGKVLFDVGLLGFAFAQPSPIRSGVMLILTQQHIFVKRANRPMLVAQLDFQHPEPISRGELDVG